MEKTIHANKTIIVFLLLLLFGTSAFAQVTNLPNGISTDAKTEPFGKLPVVSPVEVFQFFDDFTGWDADGTGDIWTTTYTASGIGAASGVISATYGVLEIVSATTANDKEFFESAEIISFVTGNEVWFSTRIKASGYKYSGVSTAITTDVSSYVLIAGVGINTATAPNDYITDGVFFRKNSLDTQWQLIVASNADAAYSSGITSATPVDTLVADTWVELSFYYDGASEIKWYVDRVYTGTVATTTLTQDELCTVMFGIMSGTQITQENHLDIDYIYAAERRR